MNAIHIANGYYVVKLRPYGYAVSVKAKKPSKKNPYRHLSYYLDIESALRGYLRTVEEEAVKNLTEACGNAEQATITELVKDLSISWNNAVEDIRTALKNDEGGTYDGS